jgi:gliding motility-associated-like protein
MNDCSYRYIGNSQVGFGDIAQCPNGKLYGISGGLYEIDTANGLETLLTYDIGGGVALVCDDNNNLLLLGDYLPDSVQNGLLSFNTITFKTIVLVDSIDFYPYGDLCFNNGKLYSIGGSNTTMYPKLSEINLSPYSIKISTLDNDTFYGAFGMATVLEQNCNTKIIAFSGKKAHEIFPDDGIYKLLCDFAFEYEVNGASAVFNYDNSSVKIAVPSAFTPNLDNKNETFKPIMLGNSKIVSFRIYNRWGELLHDNPEVGWDGKFNGQIQPSDNYAYYIEIEKLGAFSCKDKFYKKIGVVILLR